MTMLLARRMVAEGADDVAVLVKAMVVTVFVLLLEFLEQPRI